VDDNRPSEVKVGPFTFKIIWSQQKLMVAARTMGQDVFGQSYMDRLRIIIDDSRPLVAMQNTLMHEIFHCMVWAYDIPVPKIDSEHDMEEQFTCRIDTPFLLLLKENRSVFDWLAMED
jgi:homospermidine synthase